MTGISIRITGDKEFVQAAKSITSTGRLDLTSGLARSGVFLKRFYSGDVFAGEGIVYGQKWRPLSWPYVEWKADRYPGRTILVRKGDMIRSFRAISDARTLTIDNTDWKFPFHQLGTSRLPQRMMMKLDEQRAKKVSQLLEEDLATQLRARGLQ